jgi:D-apionolactonase
MDDAAGQRSPLVLRAGPLVMEWQDGGLRYIRLGEQEIVRRVYAAVRDANWGTVPDEIANVELTRGERDFRLTFEVHCRQNEIDFSWRGTIVGETPGRIEFVMDGVAHSMFRRNRIGFCILHPMELAGTEVEVTHADGTRRHSAFPRFIAPQNPFQDIVGLQHAAGSGADVRIALEGDIFETEDQRNWSDASYKTFCTPLSRPFPVEVKSGARVWQRVVIAVVPQAASPAPHPAAGVTQRHVTLEVGKHPVHPLPKIGFALGEAPSLTDREVARLRQLKPAHLHCAVRLPGCDESALQRGIELARQLSAPLDVALHLGDAEGELERFLERLQQSGTHVARWTLLPLGGWWTTRAVVERHARRLRAGDPDVPLGGGTPASFCELNRNRPPIDVLDFVTWSLQPQEHAFDNRSLTETLAAQGAIVASARQFCDLPLVVGPITLKKRVNPVATGDWPPDPAAGQLPLQVDPRQATLFGAGWTLGSIKYLAESGVMAATYYELLGWKGLMEREAGAPLTAQFPSVPGGVFPLYHVLADVAEYAGGFAVPVRSTEPLAVEALALTTMQPNGPADSLLIANLTDAVQQVVVRSTGTRAEVRVMTAENVLAAVQSPEAFRAAQAAAVAFAPEGLKLELLPHAYAHVALR